MAEYEVRKLYDIATQPDAESGTYESMWAYYIRYPQAEYSTPGRFRIRITRMTAGEFMAMMGVEEEHHIPPGAYSIQGYIEKWSDKGWLQCIDWIGAPESSNTQIEQDLLEMYEAFTTGRPTTIASYDPPPPPRKPKKATPQRSSPTLIKFPSKEKDENKDSSTENKAKKDPFDWV